MTWNYDMSPALHKAVAWLQQCHDWLLETDLDMSCPMEADPLDIIEELKRETIAAAALRIEVPAELREKVWQGERMYQDWLVVSAPPPARHSTLLHPMCTLIGHATGPKDQGFLTSTGRYVGRDEAMQIAVAASQVDPANRKSGSSSSHLFSEDLW